MKNLKKLTRGELKSVKGGTLALEEPGTFACCMTDGSGRCSTTVYGDSNDLMCVTPGTVLVDMG